MMATDDDVREMLQRRAADVTPSPDAWRRIGELCDEAGRARSELPLSIRLYLGGTGTMEPAQSIAGAAAAERSTSTASPANSPASATPRRRASRSCTRSSRSSPR